MLMRGRGTVTALDRQLRAMMEERDQLRRELLEQEHAARLRQQQADQLAARLEELRDRNGVREADIEQWRQQLHEARLALRGQEVTLEKERKATTEKLELLERNRDALKQEFENLANRIFEQKSERFSQQTRTSLDTLLNPFR